MLATQICQLAVDCILNDLQARSSDRLTAKPMSCNRSFVCDTRTSLDHTLAQPLYSINLGDPPLFSPGSVCQVGQDATYIPQNEPAHDDSYNLIVLIRGEMQFQKCRTVDLQVPY
ncbi:hypothetical protein T06_1913 [Trichinella sp. T6]|nr:hypothetical protein T06_1913 [Trichinella sp. T6]